MTMRQLVQTIREADKFIVTARQEYPMRTCETLARMVFTKFDLIISTQHVSDVLNKAREEWRQEFPGLCGPDW